MEQSAANTSNIDIWPSLPLSAWQDTYTTLHLWLQIIGKIKLKQAPVANHWWQVPLYVTTRGITTAPIPHSSRTFQFDLDFIAHQLYITTNDNAVESMPLTANSVSVFYREIMARLHEMALPVKIWTTPVEVPKPIPFEQDNANKSYDKDYSNRLWRILVQTERILNQCRSNFLGKISPIHFFWGSFDLALSRFSGRRAPPHPGAPFVSDFVTREAYSHEVSSCGFWPGGGPISEPIFYAYIYPEPPGYNETALDIPGAYYSNDLREFVLPYQCVRQAQDPDKLLRDFFQNTYITAADLAGWDRAALERTIS